ncbi:hypothetical protein [Muricoccus radiodurans]|uniref:hypothetical protein n=1 Tax=Muricoccus radiodurans TaxID=2231721 RepID=UPI003CF09F0D
MIVPIINIVIMLGLLVLLPYVWPQGFSEPPLIVIGLLAVAAIMVIVAGHRRRKRGWGTDAST